MICRYCGQLHDKPGCPTITAGSTDEGPAARDPSHSQRQTALLQAAAVIFIGERARRETTHHEPFGAVFMNELEWSAGHARELLAEIDRQEDES